MLENNVSTKWRTDGMKQRALTKPFEIIQQLYFIKGWGGVRDISINFNLSFKHNFCVEN